MKAVRSMDIAIRRSRRCSDQVQPQITQHKLNGVDASSLPPCETELQQHIGIRRSAFVAKMRDDADQQTIGYRSTPIA